MLVGDRLDRGPASWSGDRIRVWMGNETLNMGKRKEKSGLSGSVSGLGDINMLPRCGTFLEELGVHQIYRRR